MLDNPLYERTQYGNGRGVTSLTRRFMQDFENIRRTTLRKEAKPVLIPESRVQAWLKIKILRNLEFISSCIFKLLGPILYFWSRFTVNSEAPEYATNPSSAQDYSKILTYLVMFFVAKCWTKRAYTSISQNWQNGRLRVKVLRINHILIHEKTSFSSSNGVSDKEEIYSIDSKISNDRKSVSFVQFSWFMNFGFSAINIFTFKFK